MPRERKRTRSSNPDFIPSPVRGTANDWRLGPPFKWPVSHSQLVKRVKELED